MRIHDVQSTYRIRHEKMNLWTVNPGKTDQPTNQSFLGFSIVLGYTWDNKVCLWIVSCTFHRYTSFHPLLMVLIYVKFSRKGLGASQWVLFQESKRSVCLGTNITDVFVASQIMSNCYAKAFDILNIQAQLTFLKYIQYGSFWQSYIVFYRMSA